MLTVLKNQTMTTKTYLYVIMMVLLSACTGGKQNSFSSTDEKGDTIAFKYAKNIVIVDLGDKKKVVLKDPWNEGKELNSYVIGEPMKRMLISTSVHCALYEELGCADNIAGVCDPNYIYLPFIQDGLKSGKVKDCGSSMQPDVEKVVDLQPDAIFVSPYQGSNGYGKIAELGIPIIEVADYMEVSPLGRAEWMIFYGMLVGKEKEARELFAEVEKQYLEQKESAHGENVKSCPTVMMDKMVQATWYVPGGESTIGQLLKDANSKYVFADDKSSGSLEKSYEQVLDAAINADVWLMRCASEGGGEYNKETLLKENEKYSQFKAFKSGEIYGCDTNTSKFFEETPFHPERLLKDFVSILHPEVLKAECKYFFRLK